MKLWQTEPTEEQRQKVSDALAAQRQAKLTNHTPESALEWITKLCEALQVRGIDYKDITFLDVAAAVEKQEKRRGASRKKVIG